MNSLTLIIANRKQAAHKVRQMALERCTQTHLFLDTAGIRAPRRDAYGCAPSASLAHVVAAQSPPEGGP